MKDETGNSTEYTLKMSKSETVSPSSLKERRRWYYINTETLPLKVTLFLYYGAMSAVLPYLTIHMKDIGISMAQISIIYAVLPITAFLSTPIMGFLADKMGHYKAVLIVVTVINGLAHSLLLAVPKYSESLVYHPTIVEFDTTGGGLAVFKPLRSDLCPFFVKSIKESVAGQGNAPKLSFHVHSCSWEESNSDVDPLISRKLNSTELWDLTRINKNVTFDLSNNRTRRSVMTNERLSEVCAVTFDLSEIFPADAAHKHVICQTNYSFPNGDIIPHGNGQLTFWLYFAIRIVSNIFMNACFSLLDATTLAMVKMNKGAEYGRERIFGVVGTLLASPLAGLQVDMISKAVGYTDYSSAFYTANVLLALNIVGYIFMKLDVEKPEDDAWKNVADLFKYREVLVFLMMIFIMGNMWGFVESYLFIFLDELHAPKSLLGLTLTVGSLAGLPFLWTAETLVAKAGRVNILVLAFLVYFVRFFGYSYITDPYWCFPFEAMEAFTYHLMWAAAATYCAVLAPKGLLGTLTGVMGSLHYALGRGSGAFVGGQMIYFMSSSRLAFRYFGIFAGVMGLIYFLINKLWLETAIRRRNELENNQDIGNEDQHEQKINMLPVKQPEDSHENA